MYFYEGDPTTFGTQYSGWGEGVDRTQYAKGQFAVCAFLKSHGIV